VLVRLNPELGAGGGVHPYLSTGMASAKFGIPLDQLEEVFNILAASSRLIIVGKGQAPVEIVAQNLSEFSEKDERVLTGLIDLITNHGKY
jgi:hypothetical protein